MNPLRSVSLVVALASASALIACTTAPAMPMGAAYGGGMATPEHMDAMHAQMTTMREMHTKMMNARTPEERQALMADHMKAMQGGMAMMKGMGGMSGMDDPKSMPADMGPRHKVMAQQMAMMQMMMDMMMQRMPQGVGQK